VVAGLTNGQQDRLIRASWPAFKTVIAGNRLAIWRGVVHGLAHPYTVEIIYARNRHGDPFRYAYAPFPEVTVIDPPLARRAEDPDGPIPHVYIDPERDQPVLCLFDPRDGGWTRDQAIADTVLVWTASWLRFYEAWHATGVWTGGSARHGPRSLSAPAAVDDDMPKLEDAAPSRGQELFCGASVGALLTGLTDATPDPWAAPQSANEDQHLAAA
jgi:hypothetical protein